MVIEKKEGTVPPQPKKKQAEELHTDAPISEKDEVKKAESKMRKPQKKQS